MLVVVGLRDMSTSCVDLVCTLGNTDHELGTFRGMASGIYCAVSDGDLVFGQPGFPLLSANIINMCGTACVHCGPYRLEYIR